MKYPELVRDYFFNPQHVGTLTGDSVIQACFGDELQLNLEVRENTIKSARFKALGDPYTIAAMEWLCRQIEGLSFNSLFEFNIHDCVTALELPASKHYIVILLQNCLNLIKVQLNRNAPSPAIGI